MEQFKQKYADLFAESLQKAAEMVCDTYFRSANQNVVLFISVQAKEAANEVNRKKEQMETLLKLKENGNNELIARKNQCRQYLANLEELDEN